MQKQESERKTEHASSHNKHFKKVKWLGRIRGIVTVSKILKRKEKRRKIEQETGGNGSSVLLWKTRRKPYSCMGVEGVDTNVVKLFQDFSFNIKFKQS